MVFRLLFISECAPVLKVFCICYLQYGFAKRKSTSKVETTKIYDAGKYFLGPDYEFKKYRADAHNIILEKITAFTSDKVEVCVHDVCDSIPYTLMTQLKYV